MISSGRNLWEILRARESLGDFAGETPARGAGDGPDDQVEQNKPADNGGGDDDRGPH